MFISTPLSFDDGKAINKMQARRPAKIYNKQNRIFGGKVFVMMKYIFAIILLLSYSFSYSQEKKDSIIQNNSTIILDTVNIFSLQTKKNSFTGRKKATRIKEPKLYYSTLKSFVSEKTNLYVKEYGRGMISGISIRGTSASHTQILWNGIPINSNLNGQTDLNTIYISSFNKLRIYLGGASVFVGSGAIGGAIDISHSIDFKNKFSIENNFEYGSFNSINNSVSLTKSSDKYYFNLNLTGNYSKNDYAYPKTEIKNQNGKYFGKDLSLNSAVKINKNNKIDVRAHFNILERNLSGTLYTTEKSKLDTKNYQTLFGWDYQKNKLSNRLVTAIVFENFDYYQDKNADIFSSNQSSTLFIKNTTGYTTKNNRFILGNQLKKVSGKGTGIGDKKIDNYSVFANWKRQIFEQFSSNISIRKEFNSLYKIPFLGNLELAFINKKIESKFSISNNFKVPTFNDLYWKTGGNPNLKPEKSYTIEFNQGLTIEKTQINLGVFYINSTNLIRWKPFTSNIWKPVNIQNVVSKGIEFSFIKSFNLSDKNNINLFGNYTYQQIEDINNNSLLTFVPKHIANFTANLSGKKYEISFINSYTGKVFTTTSNSKFMKAFYLLNFNFSYKITNNIRVGGAINNVLNNYYETYPSRPQPGRNFNLNINIKI